MIADHFEKRPDSGLRAALGFHLAVDSALAVCLGFGLYALLHPSDVSSSYLVEYQALPAAVVTGDTPALPVAAGAPIAPEPRITSISTTPATVMLQPEATAEPELAPQPEVALTQPPEAKPTVAPPAQRRTVKKPNRDVRMGTSNRRSGCIPAYDSSGAQTRPCG